MSKNKGGKYISNSKKVKMISFCNKGKMVGLITLLQISLKKKRSVVMVRLTFLEKCNVYLLIVNISLEHVNYENLNPLI